MPKVLWVFLGYGVALGVPLALVILAMACIAQRNIERVASLPADGGPAAFQGRLTRSTGLLHTPMGALVAGWSGAVRTSRPSGKTHIYSWDCRLVQLGGLQLEGNPLSLPSSSALLQDDLDLLSAFRSAPGNSYNGPRSSIAAETSVSDTLPAEVPARCTLPPLQPKEKRVWIEQRLPAGVLVTFIGCRNASGLTPCGTELPGDGTLVVGSRRELVGRLLSTSLGMTAALVLVFIFFAFVAAGYTLPQLRRYARDRAP
jgi:hypothetical protein